MVGAEGITYWSMIVDYPEKIIHYAIHAMKPSELIIEKMHERYDHYLAVLKESDCLNKQGSLDGTFNAWIEAILWHLDKEAEKHDSTIELTKTGEPRLKGAYCKKCDENVTWCEHSPKKDD